MSIFFFFSYNDTCIHFDGLLYELNAIEAHCIKCNRSSGNPYTLAKEFDLAVEEAGMRKSFSLYSERRFTVEGHTAGALLDCYPIFNNILDETCFNNLLVQSCDYIAAVIILQLLYQHWQILLIA